MMGRPQMSFRNSPFFTIRPEAKISHITSTAIGTRPPTRGLPVSCIGTDARFEISSVTTSSLVWSSLICRFPISLTAATTTMYSSRVRTKEIAIFYHRRLVSSGKRRLYHAPAPQEGYASVVTKPASRPPATAMRRQASFMLWNGVEP